MNKTKIEWCNRTWNPVKGCYHNCPYCYARNIAHRFAGYKSHVGIALSGTPKKPLYVLHYPCRTKDGRIAPYPFDFAPTFHRYYFFKGPEKIKKPQNIFVGSMCDLFGDWVPDEWINDVFEACEKAPQHRYLFLTKNRSMTKNNDRLSMLQRFFNSGNNKWLGYSVESGYKLSSALNMGIKNTFLSMEPLAYNASSPFRYGVFINSVKWVILGAETGNRKGKMIPNRECVEAIVSECRRNKIPVFLKDSLQEIWGKPLIQEYPWGNEKQKEFKSSDKDLIGSRSVIA
jgi:protein gp37